MDFESQVREGSDEALQRLHEMNEKLKFDELLRYATEVCLQHPPSYEVTTDKTEDTEQKIIAHLGLRGLRAAVELSEGYVIKLPLAIAEHDVRTEEELDTTKGFYLDLDSPLLYPETWSTALDPEITEKTKRFGKALIAEAYLVLGKDVDEKITLLQSAASTEEQMEVIDWLHDRIHAITRGGEPEPDDEYKHFYHPIRLSPKITGVYPDHQLVPTCLAVSVITDSFLERAGLATLHVGVNESGAEKNVGAGMYLAKNVLDKHDTYTMPLSNPAEDAVRSVYGKLIETYSREEAQHAAVYARLADGTWAQVDPNFNATFTVREKDANDSLTKAYAMLHDLEDSAPGLEISALLPGFATTAETIEGILDRQKPEIIAEIRKHTEDILTSGIDESVLHQIYRRCIVPYFYFSDGDDALALNQLILSSIQVDHLHNHMTEPVVEETFYKLVDNYVLWGDSIDTFLRNVQRDPEYRKNRIDDIVSLPLMIAVGLAKSEVEQALPWHVHHKLDIGLPASRIGMSVLSDFAVHDDASGLSNSFWISHWPGNTAVAEHLAAENISNADKKITRTNLMYYRLHPFTSTKNHDIIKSFLPDEREED